MSTCSDVTFDTLSGKSFIYNSCSYIVNSSNYSSIKLENVSHINFVPQNLGNVTRVALCEFDDDTYRNGTLLFNTNDVVDIDVSNSKYYGLTYRNQYPPQFNFVRCIEEQRSEIAIMSEELAFGTGNSIFTNLNELTPVFIAVIGFILS